MASRSGGSLKPPLRFSPGLGVWVNLAPAGGEDFLRCSAARPPRLVAFGEVAGADAPVQFLGEIAESVLLDDVTHVAPVLVEGVGGGVDEDDGEGEPSGEAQASDSGEGGGGLHDGLRSRISRRLAHFLQGGRESMNSCLMGGPCV